MKFTYTFCLIFVALLFGVVHSQKYSIGPFLGGVAALSGAVYFGVKCKIDECCDAHWIDCDHANQSLSEAFQNKFYGQHIAARSLLSAVSGYCSRDKISSATPWKALAVSLHGPSGVGKSHVSRLVAETLFKKGMRSSFVHFFDLSSDLRTDEELSKLHDWILGNATICPHQLFIFTEIDKADVNFAVTLDKLHKFFDHGAHELGVDFAKLMFIFMGNLGTLPLVEEVTERYRLGQRREDIPPRALELLLERAAFSEEAGLFRSEIVKRKLIDAFVPFLPMERHHVELCVQNELNTRYKVIGEDGVVRVIKTITPAQEERIISSVLDQLEFEPDNEDNTGERFFAVSGCKEVQRLVHRALSYLSDM